MSYEILREMGRGGNQPNLNVGMLKEFEVFNPPIDLQVRFSSIISKVETQIQLTQQSLQKSEELFQSLLQRAFKGSWCRDIGIRILDFGFWILEFLNPQSAFRNP